MRLRTRRPLLTYLGVPALLHLHHVQCRPAHSSLTDERLLYSVYCVASLSRLQGSHLPSVVVVLRGPLSLVSHF